MITGIINHNFTRIIWFFTYRKKNHNALILIKSVSIVNKNENNYYYKIIIEKWSYENKFNT